MWGMLNSGVVLLHDNMLPHMSRAARTPALLRHFNWELFDHPPHSPNRAPSDHHLFIYLKNWPPSQLFNNNEDLIEGVNMWLCSQAADFFEPGTQKRIPLYDNCLNSSCDYVDK
jgi:hypothetical protein